jgi:two-component system, LytTR family, response regulator LytT
MNKMETRSNKNDLTFDAYRSQVLRKNDINYVLKPDSGEKTDEVKNVFQKNSQTELNDLLIRLEALAGKTRFLVFKHNKYITIPIENIAYFYLKYEESIIMCFNRQEYLVNYSLKHIQDLLSGKQFFRLNRQYLVNFYAVKNVEHYFARKLLVNLAVPVSDKLLISKEKANSFLSWLDDR